MESVRHAVIGESPLPLQYLGSKQRISSWLLDEIQQRFPESSTFVDLMSGTGSVALEAHRRGMTVFVNDLQPYSHRILQATFTLPRTGLAELSEEIKAELRDDALTRGRGWAADLLQTEDAFVASLARGDFDWEAYRRFCRVEAPTSTGDFDLFATYYANTYFGVRQCLEIDLLRRIAERSAPDLGAQLVAALISAMSFNASTTTHLAQFLKPQSKENAESLLNRRRTSMSSAVIDRLTRLSGFAPAPGARATNLRFEDALQQLPIDGSRSLIYADPPYFKEHYSRYYHVLDTAALYDYPELTHNPRLGGVSVGRYRDSRLTSEFGLKSRAPHAFSELFRLGAEREAPVAVSYASTSIVPRDVIVAAAASHGYQSSLATKTLRHSGQGQGGRNSDVTEFLFMFDLDA